MFFQVPPTPTPTQPPEVVRTESAYLRVARKDVPILISREKAAPKDPGEKALIRYQLFVRTDIEARQDPARPDGPPPPVHCQWVVTSYLEREPCFESITGKLACAESYTVRLDDTERGHEVLPLTEEATACALTRPGIAAAQAGLGAIVEATADQRFADDLERRLRPTYTRMGLKAAMRPLR
ncbi:MAG: hypothetical protein JNL41_09155 [Phenylobacterium sp.]|uniref:hypothetical protein n=1 Tax=Phenylobacterium sp. TaxID=1871053 RepID=UPI001A58B11A|nr:hypothetical protein [Phenylobacterium sp.]MBL8554432.1 hypothetical protein [Phenylobacterium sp.]